MGIVGSAPMLAFHEEQESPTEAGERSAMSDPLPDHVDYDNFLDAIVDSMRYPVGPQLATLLKSCEVSEEGAEEFHVKVVLDGEKLARWGVKPPAPGIDRVHLWNRVQFSREDRTIHTTTYKPGWERDGGEDTADRNVVFTEGFSNILRNPLRCEFWLKVQGARFANRQCADLMQEVAAPIIQSLARRKVRVMHDAPSPSCGSNKSVISEPLGEHISYNAFFDTKLVVLKTIPGTVVEELSPTEFQVKLQGAEGPPATLVTTITHDKEAGEIATVLMSEAGVVRKVFTKLHRQPLCLECWLEDQNGQRNAGRAFAKEVQAEVDQIMEKNAGIFQAIFG